MRRRFLELKQKNYHTKMEQIISYKTTRPKVNLSYTPQQAELTPQKELQAAIQVAFCLLLAEDCIVELYGSDLKNDTNAKCLLLECRQTIQSLWKSIKTQTRDDIYVMMISTGDAVDDYEEELQNAFNKMKVSDENWNDYVVKYFGVYTFLISANTAIEMIYKKKHRHFLSAINKIKGLYRGVVADILDQHGLIEKTDKLEYLKPIIDFIYDYIEPATYKIAETIKSEYEKRL